MSITGTGGNSSGDVNIGVFVGDGTITNIGSGTLTIAGNGGGNTNSSYDWGINIRPIGGAVSTVNGALTVTGTGGGAGSGIDNWGVYLENSNGGITSTGSAPITVTGIRGGGDTSSNQGINLTTWIGATNTIGGASATGNITIIADTLSLDASTTIQTTGNVIIKPYTAATTVGVGNGAGTLSLDDTTLGYIHWGTAAGGKSLTIGSTASGNLAIDTASTILNKSVNFISGGNISLANTTLAHAGGSASTLGMYANGNVTIGKNISASGSALNVIIQSDVDANAAGATTLSDNITTGGGTISFNDDVTLTTNIVLNAGNSISFASTVDGAHNLTATAGTGTATFTGIVGGGAALGNLTITADDLVFGGNVFGTGRSPSLRLRRAGPSTSTPGRAG